MKNYFPPSNTRFEVVVEEHKFQNLFFAELYLDTFINSLRETFGAGMHNNFFELNGDYMRWAVDVAGYNEMSAKFMQLLTTDPNFVEKINVNLFNAVDKLNVFSRELLSIHFSKKTNSELLQYYEKQRSLVKETLRYGLFAPMIEVKEPLYTDFLTKLLSEKAKHLKTKISIVEAVAVLCSFEGETIAKQEQRALLKLAIKVKQLANYDKELEKHAVEYGWLSYNFSGPGWNKEDYLRMIKQILAENPEDKLAQLEHSESKMEKTRVHFENTLQLNSREKQFFSIARNFMKAKALRREALSFTGYAGEKLCIEMAKRLNLSLLQVRLMTFQEITTALKGGVINTLELNNRTKHLLFGLFEDGKQTVLVTGKNVEPYPALIVREQIDNNLSTLTGKCACTGNATGKVRIVNNPQDMKKMQKGDVLISIATSPDIVPAMRLASAIVTDAGGLTSHAAIVSRELHVPCVIGTKIATKLLIDGEVVTVDATNGIVTRQQPQ